MSGDTITRVISRQVLVPYDLSNESGGDSTNIIEGVVFLSKSDIKGWSEDLRRNCIHIYLNGISVDSSTEFGVYQCFTENLDSNIAAEHTDYFVVQEETLKITGVSSSYLKVNKPEDVTLACTVAGYPLKVLKWRKNGDNTSLNTTSPNLLWNSPTSLTISKVVLEDAGYYQCETESGILSEEIKVEVVVQNKLVSMKSDRSEYVEGADVVFELLYEVNEHDSCIAEVHFRKNRVEGAGVISERIKVLQIDNSSR